MPAITALDGTSIYYKDWGYGEPVVFSHGWPLSADSWESCMMVFASHGFRCVAHDRRGHGRSSQTWIGNNMDTFADDLNTLIDKLDLKGVVLFGFSMGGGEVARYIGRYGTKRLSRVGLVSSVTPLMLQTPANPGGLPVSVFDDLRNRLQANRAQLFRDLADGPFYGFNRPGAKASRVTSDWFWMQGMMASAKSTFDCIKAFSETDFTPDLKKFDIPTLIIHGDDDQIVPIAASALMTAKIVRGSTLKVYKGAPHGMCTTRKKEINEDLLAFITGAQVARAAA